MSDIIIKHLGDLKDIIIENLKEGTVISLDLTGKEGSEDVRTDGNG